jgi:hypothetical protein
VAAAAVGLSAGLGEAGSGEAGDDGDDGGGGGGGDARAASRYNALLAEEALATAKAWVARDGGREARVDVRSRMVAAIEARRHAVTDAQGPATPDAVSLFQGYQRYAAAWWRLKKGLEPAAGSGSAAAHAAASASAAEDDEYSEDGSGSLGGGGALAQAHAEVRRVCGRVLEAKKTWA